MMKNLIVALILFLSIPTVVQARVYSMAIFVHDYSGSLTPKEGDVIAVKPRDFPWGNKTVRQFLIVLVELGDAFPNQEDARRLEVPSYITGDVWHPSIRPELTAKRRYKIDLSLISARATSQGVTIDWTAVKDSDVRYQPLLDGNIVFTFADLIHEKFGNRKLNMLDLDIIRKAGKKVDAVKTLP